MNNLLSFFICFTKIVDDYIKDKTAVDDRRHSNITEDGEVIVNTGIAVSYASIYRECTTIAQSKDISDIPSYKWFLLQFWPCSRSISGMVQYTGRFKVKRMVQARILRKHNPDAQYVNAIFVNNPNDSIFFSTDAKCKITVGEPDYPIAAVNRGKKVIVGINQSFQVGDHDFSKISIIPDAILVHDIPHMNTYQQDEEEDSDTESDTNGVSNHSWYRGQVYYAFKNMVLEDSTAVRGVVELGTTIESHYGNICPPRFYVVTDGGGDRRVDYLSVQKALISLFLYHDFDEIIAIRTAAGLSYRNPVERVHSIANLGLQSVGMMRARMAPQMERAIKNRNSNAELRKCCKENEELSNGLSESLAVPIDFLKGVFSQLSLKGKKFKISEAASGSDIEKYSSILKVFGDDIGELNKIEHLSRFPMFREFLSSHCVRRTYYFHVFNCNSANCEFHKPIRKEPIESFGDPEPYTDNEGIDRYRFGNDPEEKFMPSKLLDASKRSSNIPFPATAKTSQNVGSVIDCTQCRKPRLLHSKSKLTDSEKCSLKRVFNGYSYICGSSLQDIMTNERNRDYAVISVYCKENISCVSTIELPYCSSKIFKNVCVYCALSKSLTTSDKAYPQCDKCKDKPEMKNKKRKTVTSDDLAPQAKKKTN